MTAISSRIFLELQGRVAQAAAAVMTPQELARFTIRMHPKEDCLVASEAGPVKMLYVIEDEDAEQPTLRIDDILIREDRRGAGIGTAIITAVKDFCAEEGLDLNLSANPLEEYGDPSRPAAKERLICYYERLGFENERGVRNGDMVTRSEGPAPSP